jgi:hypothetical protein
MGDGTDGWKASRHPLIYVISLLCGYHSKRGIGGVKAERIEGEREGNFMDNLKIQRNN